MPIYPNDAKYYAGIIYKGLHLNYKRKTPNALYKANVAHVQNLKHVAHVQNLKQVQITKSARCYQNLVCYDL